MSWTHVNGACNKVGPTSYTLTLGFTPAAGNLLLVAAEVGVGSIGISDNSSGPADVWANIVPAFTWDAGTGTFAAWATVVTNGTAPTTVTITPGGAVLADNYTGGPGVVLQDGAAATLTGAGTGPSVNYTTGAKAGDLLWSVVAIAGAGTCTVASPFTIRTYTTQNLGSSDDAGVSASTKYTVTYTIGNYNWAVFTVGLNSTFPARARAIIF